MVKIKIMIQYRAKHPELYPRYANWTDISVGYWGMFDFKVFNVKIDDTIYTDLTDEYMTHFNKAQMWEKLKL